MTLKMAVNFQKKLAQSHNITGKDPNMKKTGKKSREYFK